jgi:hypothetical protein
MSTTSPRSRPAPPPVVDPNPPRSRPAPPVEVPEADNAPANLAAAAAMTAPAPTPAPVAVPPAVEQARPEPQGDLLASLLASTPPPTAEATAPMSDGAAMLLNLAAMRQQQVDPMTDYAADGTRMLRFVQAAVQHYASLTGTSQQQVLRDALLGVRPLPAELLDAHYLHLYKTPRPRT